MRVIVVHEDGDRSSRVAQLLDEVRECVRTESMQHQGVRVDMKFEGDL